MATTYDISHPAYLEEEMVSETSLVHGVTIGFIHIDLSEERFKNWN